MRPDPVNNQGPDQEEETTLEIAVLSSLADLCSISCQESSPS